MTNSKNRVVIIWKILIIIFKFIDGTVFAWGSAKDGGLGTWKHDAHQPQKMEFDVKFNHIGAGVNFNVAISGKIQNFWYVWWKSWSKKPRFYKTEKGQLYTWGDGEYGK
jgi:hypothetical protein